jgi:hypothetical protein
MSLGNILNIYGIICEVIALILIYGQVPTDDEKMDDTHARLKGNADLDDSDTRKGQKWIYFLIGFGLFCQILGTNFP